MLQSACFNQYAVIFRQFLGTVVKLRKSIVRFVMSVRPLGTTRLPPDRFSLSLRTSRQSVDKIQVCLKYDKNDAT